MFRKIMFAAIVTSLPLLLPPGRVQAWGAAHSGYTSVGSGGVQHYGSNTVSGPRGTYTGSHSGSYSSGGASHTGSGYGTTGSASGGYHYSGTSSYGSYHGTGYGTVGTYGSGGYHGGVYYGR